MTNNIEINKIYTIKLLTGEEVVAKVSEVHADHILLQQPILAMLTPQGLQLMPALFTANQDKSVRLNIGSWALLAETREDIRNSWIQATTGIAPVSKQIITG